eukprot:1211536-Rhodomonas_salina.2
MRLIKAQVGDLAHGKTRVAGGTPLMIRLYNCRVLRVWARRCTDSKDEALKRPERAVTRDRATVRSTSRAYRYPGYSV